MTGKWQIPHIVLILCRFMVVVSDTTTEAQVCTYDIDDLGTMYWWDRTNDNPAHIFADNNRWVRQYSIDGAAERRMYQAIGSEVGIDLFISETWVCFNKARQGPYTYVLRKHAALGDYECAKMYVNPNRQLLVERIAKPDTGAVPSDAPPFSPLYPDCSNPNLEYPTLAQVLVKEPIYSTGKICPFDSTLYSLTIHSGDKRELCKGHSDSRVTISDQRYMIFRSCVQGNSYEAPFNGKIECVGTILPDAIASNEADGEVLILSFLPAFETLEKRYYVARYFVDPNGKVYISMMARQTTLNNMIYADPSQRFATVESTNETVTFALELRPLNGSGSGTPQTGNLPEFNLYQVNGIDKKTDNFEAGKPFTAECRINDANPDELILDFIYKGRSIICGLVPAQNKGVQCRAEIILKKSDNKAGLWQCRATYKDHHQIISIGKEVSVEFPTERVSLSSAGGHSNEVTPPGSNVVLSCKTDSANPAAKLKWQRDGVFVIDDSSTFNILHLQQEGEFNGFVSISQLSFVANDDLSGSVFHCVANHQYGTVRSNGFFLLSDEEGSKKGAVLDPTSPKLTTPGIIGLCAGLLIFILGIVITILLVRRNHVTILLFQRLKKKASLKLVNQTRI